MDKDSDDTPLVSVIIPVYNREDVIGRALDSVLNQSYRNLEIIVIDDGSSDQTVHRCRSYGERIRLITQKNAGPAAARNNGIRHAAGPFIAFLDSDDEWYPDKIEKQLRFAAEENLGMVITDSEIQTPGENRTTYQKSLFSDLLTASPKQVIELFELLVMQNFIHLSTVFISKAAVIEAGLFDETMRVAEDTDLWLRVSRQLKTGVLNEVLAKRDIREDKLSGDRIQEYLGRIRSFSKLLEERLTEEEQRQILDRATWVQGRLIYRSLAEKDFKSFRKAFALQVPRLFSRTFYNGIMSERNYAPLTGRHHG